MKHKTVYLRIGKAMLDAMEASRSEHTTVMVTVPCDEGKISFLYHDGNLKATHLQRGKAVFVTKMAATKFLSDLYRDKGTGSSTLDDITSIPSYATVNVPMTSH